MAKQVIPPRVNTFVLNSMLFCNLVDWSNNQLDMNAVHLENLPYRIMLKTLFFSRLEIWKDALPIEKWTCSHVSCKSSLTDTVLPGIDLVVRFWSLTWGKIITDAIWKPAVRLETPFISIRKYKLQTEKSESSSTGHDHSRRLSETFCFLSIPSLL